MVALCGKTTKQAVPSSAPTAGPWSTTRTARTLTRYRRLLIAALHPIIATAFRTFVGKAGIICCRQLDAWQQTQNHTGETVVCTTAHVSGTPHAHANHRGRG
eukprot:scaffold8200_cov277-Pinguiococcus_pyrenoidosus.AAC.7